MTSLLIDHPGDFDLGMVVGEEGVQAGVLACGEQAGADAGVVPI